MAALRRHRTPSLQTPYLHLRAVRPDRVPGRRRHRAAGPAVRSAACELANAVGSIFSLRSMAMCPGSSCGSGRLCAPAGEPEEPLTEGAGSCRHLKRPPGCCSRHPCCPRTTNLAARLEAHCLLRPGPVPPRSLLGSSAPAASACCPRTTRADGPDSLAASCLLSADTSVYALWPVRSALGEFTSSAKGCRLSLHTFKITSY